MTMARLVSHTWRTFVDENSPLWGRINTDQTQEVAKAGRDDITEHIFEHAEQHRKHGNWEEFIQRSLKKAVTCGWNGMSKIVLSKIFTINPSKDIITPAYILAVEKGDVELVKIFLSSLENKNPINEGTFG